MSFYVTLGPFGEEVRSLIDKEHAGNLVDGWALAFPLGNGARHGILIFTGEVSSDAEAGLRAT